MGANIFIGKRQLGERQLKILCAIHEGAELFGRRFFNKYPKHHNTLFLESEFYALKEREILRLTQKGCIKIKASITNSVGVFYEYELTNQFKKVLKHEN